MGAHLDEPEGEQLRVLRLRLWPPLWGATGWRRGTWYYATASTKRKALRSVRAQMMPTWDKQKGQ